MNSVYFSVILTLCEGVDGMAGMHKAMPDVSSGRELQRYCHGDKFMLVLGSVSLPSTTF